MNSIKLIRDIKKNAYRLINLLFVTVIIALGGCSYAEEDDNESYYMFFAGEGINGPMQRAIFAFSPSQCAEHVGANGPVDVVETNITPFLHITILFPQRSVESPTCSPFGRHEIEHNIDNDEFDYLG